MKREPERKVRKRQKKAKRNQKKKHEKKERLTRGQDGKWKKIEVQNKKKKGGTREKNQQGGLNKRKTKIPARVAWIEVCGQKKNDREKKGKQQHSVT